MSAQVAQSIMNRGLSKPSLYMVEITVNPNSGMFNANEFLQYYCKSIFLPEIDHDLVTSNGHFRQGIITQQPTGFKYAKPLTLGMIERSDYHSYQAFRKWFNKTGINSNSEEGRQGMSYRSEYVCDILLHKLEQPYRKFTRARNKKGEIKRNIYDIELKNNQEVRDNFRITWTAKFVNAYPTALSTINFGSDMRDTMTEYTVELNYDMYTIEFND